MSLHHTVYWSVWQIVALSVKKMWGFFSTQDGVQYEFDLCEQCCTNLLEDFQIPAVITEGTELL